MALGKNNATQPVLPTRVNLDI